MSGKSKEEIAFELLAKLKGVGIWGENNIEAILDMYSQCLEATAGMRPVEGQKPLALKLTEAKSESAIATAVAKAVPVVHATAPQQAAPALRQAAPAQQQAQPVVRQQQEQLRQAIQQQIPQAR